MALVNIYWTRFSSSFEFLKFNPSDFLEELEDLSDIQYPSFAVVDKIR